MRVDPWAGAWIVFLAGCGGPLPLDAVAPAPPPTPVADVRTPDATDSDALLDFLADSALWPAERRAAELRRLKTGPQTGTAPGMVAWLEPGKGVRAQDVLARLAMGELGDDRHRVLHLLQQLLKLEQELRQERERGARLQDQIERLKALELDLSQRDKTEATP